MRDRRQLIAPFRSDREDARHETRQPRAAVRQNEIAISKLDRNDGRERTELLAILDLAIDPVAHLRVVRRGQNAAMAERARAEFERTLHPADDASCHQIVRGLFDQRPFIEFVDELTVFAGDARKLGAVHGRAPEWMIGDIAVSVAEVNAVGVQRGAERTTGIAGSGRNEEALESRFGQDARIRHAVQCNAAAETEIGEAGFIVKIAGDLHQRVFEHALNAGRDVGEAASFIGAQIDRIVRTARRAEEIDEF